MEVTEVPEPAKATGPAPSATGRAATPGPARPPRLQTQSAEPDRRIAAVTRPPATSGVSIPELQGDALAAVEHRGSHIQIIAAAGSGKTEVVSQRVASLLAEGEAPESIVAFTFTEKAADELKERIRERVTTRMGAKSADQLGRLFVGTIHAFCFRLLRNYVPRYETYTALDSNQLTNFLYRTHHIIGICDATVGNGVFKSIETFKQGIDVIENELIPLNSIPISDFRSAVETYYAELDRHQYMSFGTQIVRAVEALSSPEVHAAVTIPLRHLIVDEYQDVNAAQERLIELLAKPRGCADVVVVGDDDQAIYQWRGSSVENITTFSSRYPDVALFSLLTNRRSRPGIVDIANIFARSIPGRINKEMRPHREIDGPSVSLVRDPGTEVEAAGAIAAEILNLHDRGLAFRDIAILVRSRAAYPALLEALEAAGVPVQAGGLSGLFTHPEPQVFGATYAWIAGFGWRNGQYEPTLTVSLTELLEQYRAIFDLENTTLHELNDHLVAWRDRAIDSTFNESLVSGFYALIDLLGIKDWNLTDVHARNRLGTIARFTTVLADYEGVAWRSRRDPEHHGEQVGGRSGGEWFYRNLAALMSNYAVGAYEGFGGEEGLADNGVALSTVHGSKGLEWPVVFLPSLVKTRFPSNRSGRSQEFPSELEGRFDRGRYEGSDADERRLFYVALTRARDAVFLSSFSRLPSGGNRGASPYFEELMRAYGHQGNPSAVSGRDNPLASLVALTYTDLAAFEVCPRSYVLKNELGFMPSIRPELGYGNAIHHMMRVLAERTRATGIAPTAAEVDKWLESEFFLPFANKAGHRQMKSSARKLITRYLSDYSGDLYRTWATERPFELFLEGVVVSGRADVIYDTHQGEMGRLTLVDYKTSTGGSIDALQLQIYTEAGRREGLDVDAAFVHDLREGSRIPVDVSPTAVSRAKDQIIATVESLRRRDFEPRPGAQKCRDCDVRSMCSAAPRRK